MVCLKEAERERVCVCVCVRERERERERESRGSRNEHLRCILFPWKVKRLLERKSRAKHGLLNHMDSLF